MAIGPGKYDAICTAARLAADASGILLIVVNGHSGSGFSCQFAGGPPDIKKFIAVLRDVADVMEADVK